MAISLTAGMKNALTSLQDLQDNIKTTNQRLATGKKVNSALDNALNFFVADSFSSKAKGLQSIQDNIGLGLNVLKQTDKALTSIRNSLDQAEGTLRAALNTAGTQSKITTNFNFRSASTGAADPSALFFAATTDTSTNRLQSGDSFTINLATYDANGSVVSTLGTVTVSNGNSTVQQVIDAINSVGGTVLNASGQAARVTAYLNDAGNLVIENQVNGKDPLATNNTFGLRLFNTNANGPSQNALDAFTFSGAIGASPINSAVSGQNTQSVSIVGSTTDQVTRASAAASFREVLSQIRNSSLDAGFNGTNLLQGDFLRVGFNEDSTTSITTQGRRLDSAALGFSADVGFGSATPTGDSARNFQGDREIQNALTKIRTAKSSLSGIQAQFATNSNLLTNRLDYTKGTIQNLNDGADLLTLADINEEGANLTSLQTRQQLSVTALSLANQSDQAILRLF